jgi:hypothetical protein
MNAYSKYKNRLEQFLQTEQGKRFIHFAYSIGAAIVILGAMFKLLHLPFGNEMLFIGMTTEVIVFILSAFDRPVQDYAWEKVFPVLSGKGSIGNDLVMKQSFSEEQIDREAAAREPFAGETIAREPIVKGPITSGPIAREPFAPGTVPDDSAPHGTYSYEQAPFSMTSPQPAKSTVGRWRA